MKESCDILVAGAGAIGSVLACLLAEAGHNVAVLGRGEHLAAIRHQGLLVEGIWGRHRSAPVASFDDAACIDDRYDAVLVCCKSFQTQSLLDRLGDRANSAGIAVSLQNGLGNFERIAAVYGTSRTLAARVIFGARRLRPGVAEVTVEAEPVLLGRPGAPADSTVRAWAARFDRAGIGCRASDGILGALWAKVFYNAALNPMGALLGLTYGELAADGDRRRAMNGVIAEAFAVAQAERVELDWASAEAYAAFFYDRLVPPTAGHRSSMLQDLEAGHETEIDAICGEVCRRGDLHGLPTPANRLLLALVKSRSARHNRDRSRL